MISQLVLARDDRDALSTDEIIGTCILLLFAGHETTTNLIGNGFLYSMRAPRRSGSGWSPTRRWPTSAVEEYLRYDGPSGALARVAAADIEMGGKTIREGERVFAFMNSANRDPEAFDDPERFDIGRAAEPAPRPSATASTLPGRAAGPAGGAHRRRAAEPSACRTSDCADHGEPEWHRFADPARREEPPGRAIIPGMKAMICRQWGGPEELRLEDVTALPLKDGQVRIRIKAAGVSFATTLVIAGKYQRKPPLPFAPGSGGLR